MGKESSKQHQDHVLVKWLNIHKEDMVISTHTFGRAPLAENRQHFLIAWIFLIYLVDLPIRNEGHSFIHQFWKNV
jgi:hypothetical protein